MKIITLILIGIIVITLLIIYILFIIRGFTLSDYTSDNILEMVVKLFRILFWEIIITVIVGIITLIV